MPACKICKKRIDLSITGVRAHKCKECGKVVCRNHFEFGKGICYVCADLPIARGGTPFSFIRKPSDDAKNRSKKG
ncbi:MAG: hypothetical protein JSV09_04875 [Thermoplasmata archaeon]|nr:MAG: hypothetical protein JSV09_04875 [Thermoplasmata archaeon]